MPSDGQAYVFDAVRTPRGRGRETGALHGVKPISLVTGLIDAVRERSPGLDPDRLDDLILGIVTPIGEQGGDLPRAAALLAGLPDTVGGVQVNRFCASGLEAVNQAAARVRAGWDSLLLAGGVESMSRVPMGSDGGAWAMDPETALATSFVPQGISADLIATLEGFGRDDVDGYALRSQERAAEAQAGGCFARSVIPVHDRNGLEILAVDEHPRPETDRAALARLTASFTGPLALADEVSLSLMQRIRLQYPVLTALPAHGIVDELLGRDRAGRAAGAGFYDYRDGRRARLWPGLAGWATAAGRALPMADLQERMLFAEALDALRCLDEGVLRSAADANIGSLLGIGFPAWTGGVIRYVHQHRDFTGRAAELAGRYGDRFLA